MPRLKDTHPVIWKEFENGGFVVQKSLINFTAIGVDHAQEHINKVHKGVGGLNDITTSPSTLLKYCLSTPELSRISEETETLLGYTKPTRTVCKLKKALSMCNPFRLRETPGCDESKLIHFTKHHIIKSEVEDSILSTMLRGMSAYQHFVSERICGEKNMWDKMSKVKYLGWNDNNKSTKVKITGEHVTLTASNSLLSRLLILTRSTRDIDLKEVISKYEFSPINHMLMGTDGSLHACTDKYQLIHLLENQGRDLTSRNEDECFLSSDDSQVCDANAIIIDAMVVVHEIAAIKTNISTCGDLAEHFVGTINNNSSHYTKTYVVFDQYSQLSLKEITRQRRAVGKTSSLRV